MRHAASLLAAIAAMAQLHAFAQQGAMVPPGARFYVTVSGGEARTSDALVSNTESAITNATAVHSDFDSRDTAWKAGAGYRLLPWLSLELDYADLGRATVQTSLTASGVPAGLTIDRRVDGWGASALFSWPIAPAFALYGRAGAFRANVKTEQRLAGNIVFGDTDPQLRSRTIEHSDTIARLGVGLGWQAWRNGGIHVEYEHYDNVGKPFVSGYTQTTGRADMDALWLGIRQAF
jgi:hypothetical protein